jgi:hypothetical protein
MANKLNVKRAAKTVVKMDDPTERGYAFKYMYYVVTNTQQTGSPPRERKGWSRPPDPPDEFSGSVAAKIRRLVTGKLGV